MKKKKKKKNSNTSNDNPAWPVFGREGEFREIQGRKTPQGLHRGGAYCEVYRGIKQT